MLIEVNKKQYHVNWNEFNKITHNEYNHLIIREKLGYFEQTISLIKELSTIHKNVTQCIFFNPTHGGFLPMNVAHCFKEVFILNTNDAHISNIKQNISDYKIENICWDLKKLGKDFIIFSDKMEDICFDNDSNSDNSFLQKHDPIILTTMNVSSIYFKYISNYPYSYELVNTNLSLFIPQRFYYDFYHQFHYFYNEDTSSLYYDNLIHLCIMVKNGGPQFEEMLLKNMHLIDRWTILDTGSTDSTIDIINRVLVGKKKGQLFQEPFQNFRDSRNRLLELAGDVCEFTLMLDDTYLIEGDLRGFLNETRGDQFADSFTVYIKSDDVEYGSNRLLKTSKKLKYLYKIHEVVQDDNNVNVVVPFHRAYIMDGRFDYMETRTMDRKELDLKLLYEELEDDPNNSRTYYYLAQTYNLLQNYEKAFDFFIQRMNHPNPGYIQEKVDAVFEAARIANFQLTTVPWEECEKLYLTAYALDNSRPESLYFIGIHYHLENKNNIAFEYFKKAFEIGYPVHCQYSLKPTLSYYFLPKFLTQMCYEFEDYVLGEKCGALFLEKNNSGAEYYNVILSWYQIFVKLNSSMSLENFQSLSNVENKPILCFVADGGFEPWTGADILSKGVGGSETYIIEMARYIQKNGHFKTVVFCNCVEQSSFEGVDYIPLRYFTPFIKNIEVHTCIISRFSEYIPLAIKGKTENVYLVLHDLTPTGVVIPLDPKLKTIFCLSEWHVEYFTNIFPQCKPITTHFYYGINQQFSNSSSNSAISNSNSGKKANSFIYSSFPNRGLLELLQMWSQIVEKYSDASLHIYADVNGKWVNSVEKEKMIQIRALLDEYQTHNRKKSLNIHYHGWVNKSVLSEAWKSAEYWFYPCTFAETFCLTAVEAALSKTLAVTNGLAALQNTVGSRGICIEGNTSTKEWQEKALTELFFIMENRVKREELIHTNYTWASTLSWEYQSNKLLNDYILRRK